ncbi:MAG TPA: sensor histidine kinase [Thermoleophilaceae bacterium]|jgi:signal transduction histidine kinase|nr:sensor histidine kinase [Thermoleophilaceae bacterium]
MNTAAGIAAHGVARRDRRPLLLVSYALAGLAAIAVSVGVALAGAPAHRGLVAVARAAMVAMPLAVGLYAWYRRHHERFGAVLVAAGSGLFVTTLAESNEAHVYGVGRAAGWLIAVLVVYVVLSFPTGRVSQQSDRRLVCAMGAVVGLLFLPRLALDQDFQVPSPYTSCVHHCPPNAFFALDHEPGFVDALMQPLGAAAMFAVLMAVTFRLVQRARSATPPARRMLTPVVVVAAAEAATAAVAIIARELDPMAWPLQAAAWTIAFAIPAVAIAFVLGLLRWRLFAGEALERLADCVRRVPDAPRLRRVFAEALEDQELEIVFPAGDTTSGWIDSHGRPTRLPAPDSGRSVSEVRRDGVQVAAIVHDDGLNACPELLDAGIAITGMVLENHRLAAEAAASLREVSRSRARIATSAERERRRIERDLHDGAQQRLVALRIELELAENLVRRDPERGATLLRELEGEVEEAIDELRALAHGVYPPLLADRGLGEALRAAGARCTIAVDLNAHDVGRYPPEVESAVYFCVLEALQNALKHAQGATRVIVSLDGGRSELRFSVRDDGAGTADGRVRAGAGITNMRDRLAAFGGDVVVSSKPGHGMEVRGRMPTAA